MQTTTSIVPKKPEQKQKTGWIEKCWQWMGFTHQPTLKLYPGYGHAAHLVMYGHALSFAPLARNKYSTYFLVDLLALIRLFIVKQIAGHKVRLQWENNLFNTTTSSDGFIQLQWHSEEPMNFGWHSMPVELLNTKEAVMATATGSVFIPHSTQFGFISDIDDTFLISHSANFRKRLAVLFTRNARTRKPFEGVVNHYQLLAQAHTKENEPNPFFYVSSSEWNLFDYITEFIRINGLPQGILILSSIKKLSQLLRTGQNIHGSKFARIVRILEAFPKQQFILLGDSSQQDPNIYANIVELFPERIHAIYIRDIHKRKSRLVQHVLHAMEDKGVPCCFFTHSIEAIAHSKRIGLIK